MLTLVAIAALFAAKLAGADYMKTSLEACKVGIAGFIMPFVIVFCPAVILDFSQILPSILMLSGIVIALMILQTSVVGHFFTSLSLFQRFISLAISVLILRPPAAHNILKPGDIVMFEINGIYGGISPQISYALSLGQPKKEVRRMFDLCEQLYHFSLVELEKDRTFLDIELDLARQIHESGYEPVTPQIHKYNMSNVMPMKCQPSPGDYFTVHPNLSDPGFTAAAKFGDVIRFGKDRKVQRMNRTPAKLNVL
jgi:hypothetical protein